MGKVVEVNFKGAEYQKYDWEDSLREKLRNHSEDICNILDTVPDGGAEGIDILVTNIHSQISLFLSCGPSDPLEGDLDTAREFMHTLVDMHFDNA